MYAFTRVSSGTYEYVEPKSKPQNPTSVPPGPTPAGANKIGEPPNVAHPGSIIGVGAAAIGGKMKRHLGYLVNLYRLEGGLSVGLK